MPRLARSRQTALRTATIAAIGIFVMAQPAAAGGGVRLNFGGPLGTFVATPTPGYGGGPAHMAPRKAKPHDHHARPAPKPRATVARAAPSPKPRVAHEAAAETQVPAVAAAEPAPTPPILVSRTLTAAELPATETVATTAPAETITAEDVTGDPAAETAEAAPVVTPLAPATGPVACRKFIPAVGVTVTVSCD
jgi:hypothetical protein